jgi:hypothetical protein
VYVGLGYGKGKGVRSLRRRGAWRFHPEEIPRKKVEGLLDDKHLFTNVTKLEFSRRI